MRRLLVVLAAVALTGCGGGPSAEEVLRETSQRMDEIRSATLDLRLSLEPLERAEAGRVGFALSGPLSLDGGDLPVARLRYTQIAGTQTSEAVFVSTGSEAFAEVGGTAHRLGDAQAESLREAARQVGGDSAGLPIDGWIREAEVSDGGDGTDRVTADLDPGVALRDIFAAMRAAGSEAPSVGRAGVDQLREAVDEARLELWSGKEDRLLRRLRVRIGFKVEVPQSLRRSLGDLVGGRLAFDLGLTDVNRPVRVEAPGNVE
jgi:hypothetical protein